MKVILNILKSPESKYNANNIAKVIGISAMGALKILKKLEKEEILKSKKIGNAKIYNINFDSEYALQYITFLLKKESEHSEPYIKRWIRELSKLKKAELIILFGSVLKIEKEARDIDTLIVINKHNFNDIKKQIEELNLLNDKKIHPLYQTKKDLQKYIKEENKVILNSLKGIFISGEGVLLDILKK